jgi:hypothetical protein
LLESSGHSAQPSPTIAGGHKELSFTIRGYFACDFLMRHLLCAGASRLGQSEFDVVAGTVRPSSPAS